MVNFDPIQNENALKEIDNVKLDISDEVKQEIMNDAVGLYRGVALNNVHPADAIQRLLTTQHFKEILSKTYEPKKINFLMHNFFGYQKFSDVSHLYIETESENPNNFAPFYDANLAPTAARLPNKDIKTFEAPLCGEYVFLTLRDLVNKITASPYASFSRDNAPAKIAEYMLRMAKRFTDHINISLEILASQALFEGKAKIQGNGLESSYSYWDEQDKPSLKVSKSWSDPTANIFSDISAVEALIQRRTGNTPNILVVGDKVRSCILENEKLLKILNIRNADVGEINLQTPRDIAKLGASYLGSLGSIQIYSYSKGWQEGEDKKSFKPFVPENKALLAYADNSTDINSYCVYCKDSPDKIDHPSLPESNSSSKFTQTKPNRINIRVSRKDDEFGRQGYSVFANCSAALIINKPHNFYSIEAVFGD